MSPGGFEASLPFPEEAERALGKAQQRANLRRATSTIRQKRDRMAAELADFEQLRSAAAAIKDQALSRLDEMLAGFESAFSSRGGTVHFASTAAEANSVVVRIVERAGAKEVVKVKSMTTAETALNEALAQAGVTAVETDLAELIVQLGGDLPSHIVVPAIHRNRSEVRRTFLDKMGSHGLAPPPSLSDDPAELAGAARAHLREKFLRATVGISGANFAVAETGSLVVVESEGNGRMCLSLPRVLVSVVGIDKLVPTFRDLEVFFQLLARSATGEPMNPYTSIWAGVVPGDGPEEAHVVFLDNGRSSALADRVGRQALRCIRCAACLNVCPVYERVGGHAYGSVYPGPIGAVLTPQLSGLASRSVAASLPFASTLCGACYEVCPVKIDIPRLLVHLRARSVERSRGQGLGAERLAMAAAGAVLVSPRRMQLAERIASRVLAPLARHGSLQYLPGPLGRWTATRDAPVPARESFRDWWKKRERAAPAASDDAHQGQRPSDYAVHGQRPWGHALAHEHPGAPTPRLGRGTLAAKLGRQVPSRGSGLRIGLFRGSAQRRNHRSASLQVPAPASREGVLGAVRAALAGAPFGPVEVPRSYLGPSAPGCAPPLEQFIERVSQYRARAVLVNSPAEARAAVEAALGREGSKKVVVPPGLPREWLPAGAFSVTVDDGRISPAELEGFDAAISGCTVAIASTGTVVLTGGPAQGRRALSLVPDHLVLLARAEQVVAGVPDAVAQLAEAPLQTWVSGPSATSDIELNRVEGVHGPRKLDVVVVMSAPAQPS